MTISIQTAIQTSISALSRPLFSVAVSAFTLFNPLAVQAQVGLDPIVIQTEMNRSRAQSVLNVYNPSSQPMRMRVYAAPFTYERETGFVSLQEDIHDLTPYLQFSPREFVILPGERQRVRLIALFPPGVDQSEYRAVVFTETLSETPLAAATSNIQTRIGSTVYVRQPQAEPALAVESAQWDTATRQIQLLVSNTGEATTRPLARWRLQQGEDVLAAGQGGATTVIAQGDRLLRLELDEGPQLASGRYQLRGELLWHFGDEHYAQPFTTTLWVP